MVIVQNHRADLFDEKVDYALLCRLQNWTMVCIIIEIVVEVIAITLYSIVFYRYYSSESFTSPWICATRPGLTCTSPSSEANQHPTLLVWPQVACVLQYAMSPRFPPQAYGSLGDIQETSPFTPGGRPAPIAEPQSSFAASNSPTQPFKLQAPPLKAPSATPRAQQNGFESPSTASNHNLTFTPSASASAAPTVDSDEPRYDAVPIPGAYSDQAVKSPPPTGQHSNECRRRSSSLGRQFGRRLFPLE
ncbi:hypothetical protein MCOR02_002433 [Pyricularia oryzae]|nr:hypothetical protein MCOR02_002433 [Pyricularia oryzae]